MTSVISVEHLTKQYDLGVIGTGTISRDLNRWWARVRKQPDPYTRIGQKDAFERIGESILALDDVSFTVQQGEALGIIGRNGAGKSTLLKILSRVTAPSSGVVKVKGRIGSLLEVGTGFHPELTGRENVYLNGAILGMKKAEVTRKFDEIVAFSGVEKFIDTPVKRYSSGMYVRLAFAVAAHLESEILIVDEVLAVGDAEFQKKCLGKMGDVASKEGRTVLFVSHNMGAITGLCNEAMLIQSGKAIEKGETQATVRTYLDNSQKDSTNARLFNRPRANCTGALRITEISVTGPDKFNDPLKVLIKFIKHREVEKFSVEYFIKDLHGNRVISGLSVLSEGVWFKSKGEFGSFQFTINNWRFSEGIYYLSVMFTLPMIECFDFVEDAVRFEVTNMAPGKIGFNFTHQYGTFLPETSWQGSKDTETFMEKVR